MLLFGAALTGASAVHAWRADNRAVRAHETYRAVRAVAVHEESSLGIAQTHPHSDVDRRAFFSTARHQSDLVMRLRSLAPPSQRSLIRQLEVAQAGAVVAGARTLGTDPGRDRQFARSLQLLEQVRQGATGGAAALNIAEIKPWPSTTPALIGLGDLAVLLLVGIALLAREAARSLGLRRARPDDLAEIMHLKQAALSDNLTGLGNQRAFQHDLSAAMVRRNDEGIPFSLLAFDLDGLKQVNDLEGHQAGDAYIRNVAQSISEGVNGSGQVYRTGGDEFMAILPGARAWRALSIAHAVQRLSTQQVGRRALSIGIAESTSTEGRRLLLHQADLALYEAKRAKLLAVSYHEGLEPHGPDDERSGPSQHQKVLASALAQAVDAKDAGTRNHSETVADLCTAIGARLGMTGEMLDRLRIAGLLHDVGKIGVSDAVLMKRGALADDERAEVELHTTVGHSILTSAELHREAVWVLHHHERYDGAGYPTGLAGDAIPLESRVIAVADAFEAMTGTRPYRASRTPEEALAELGANSGTQFDPRCVEALNDAFGCTEGESRDLLVPPVSAALATA